MERWFSKIALVTGASVGIGRSITEKLVAHGMKVIACARNEDKLKELAAVLNKQVQGKMFPFCCDVTDEQQMRHMFQFIKKEFGTLHVCVNNAGLGLKCATLLDGKTEDWKQMLDVNVLGLCVGTREAVKIMRESGVDDGHVININSVSGHVISNMVFYSATKHAVTALTEGLRRELLEAKTHIRATAISPGLVETNFGFVSRSSEEARKLYSDNKCLQADDVADAVMFVLQSPPHMNVNDVIIRPI